MTLKKPQYPSGGNELAPSPCRRGFIASLAAALSVSPLVFATSSYGQTMKTSDNAVLVAEAPAARQADRASIRPFTYRASDAELE